MRAEKLRRRTAAQKIFGGLGRMGHAGPWYLYFKMPFEDAVEGFMQRLLLTWLLTIAVACASDFAAWAYECDKDCVQACGGVRILGRTFITNPACRAECEAAKATHCNVLPPIAPPLERAAPPPGIVLPTRAFLPPHDIPPEDFAAYGLVAFPQKATSSTLRRHFSICEAFVATLPPASLANVPPQQQMVTVWPVDSASVLLTLAVGRPDCRVAVEHYDLPTALTACTA
jgi:hypothetical protein